MHFHKKYPSDLFHFHRFSLQSCSKVRFDFSIYFSLSTIHHSSSREEWKQIGKAIPKIFKQSQEIIANSSDKNKDPVCRF